MDARVACLVWVYGMDTTSWMEHKTGAVGYWQDKGRVSRKRTRTSVTDGQNRLIDQFMGCLSPWIGRAV